jgi:hypothetical protein
MDDGRQELSGIDRALAEALDVGVSADFRAGVRMRIANQPRPAPFWRGWRLGVAAAAAVAIAAIGGAQLLKRGTPSPDALPARTLQVAQLRPVDVRAAGPVSGADAEKHAPVIRPRVAPDAAIAGTEPEVLVPREEVEMYRRLIAAAQQLDRGVVVEASPDLVAKGDISDINIDPIRIDLIVPPPGGEGDRQ